MKPFQIAQHKPGPAFSSPSSSPSSSSSRYYKLYMRKRVESKFHVDHPKGQMLFIFALSRDASHVHVQRWTYSGLAYAAWDANAPNALAGETADNALYGLVDSRHVEDENSELRRIIDLSREDLSHHDREWRQFLDGRVEKERRKRENAGKDEETLRTEVMMRENVEWQGTFFKNLAHDKLELLRGKKLLR